MEAFKTELCPENMRRAKQVLGLRPTDKIPGRYMTILLAMEWKTSQTLSQSDKDNPVMPPHVLWAALAPGIVTEYAEYVEKAKARSMISESEAKAKAKAA